MSVCGCQVYAAPIVFERNAYEVPVFTRVHDFMWSGAALLAASRCRRQASFKAEGSCGQVLALWG